MNLDTSKQDFETESLIEEDIEMVNMISIDFMLNVIRKELEHDQILNDSDKDFIHYYQEHYDELSDFQKEAFNEILNLYEEKQALKNDEQIKENTKQQAKTFKLEHKKNKAAFISVLLISFITGFIGSLFLTLLLCLAK